MSGNDIPIPFNGTLRKEIIKSGSGGRPYYYIYWKDPETKRLKKKYVKSLHSIPRIIKAKYIARKNGFKFSTKGEWISYILSRMHEVGIYYYDDEKIDTFLDSELRK